MAAKLMLLLTEKDKARFWSKVDKRGPDECWEWRGTKLKGYGRLRSRVGQMWAHRVAWVIANGEIPNGLCVCHACDHRPCTNPAHLWLGTQRENRDDCTRKDRNARGKEHGTHTRPEKVCRGAHNGAAKLTENDVREIRRLHAQGGIFQKSLAAQFGITRTNVGRIVLGKIWRHIE